ncbi:nucleoside recognition domain-containing protein [Sedimentibacter sp. B4]|uniref:nucleoside recognition domain-containing protein n=1 Tax=Sedimentibacter sp. B4 TaxID=304766 RepID=UPI0004B7386D|nr:nucleoside recognition domain-containing protein [Sedimentibacter sp. B4]
MAIILNLLSSLIAFLWSIARILIPIMIVIEIFKDTKLIDKISNAFKPVSNFFTLSEQSGISMLFGIIFGLTIGAGAIIQSTKDYDIDKRSIFLICMFLSLCHAIFEDSIIFAAAGANPVALLIARFLSATMITFIFSRIIKKETTSDNTNKQ